MSVVVVKDSNSYVRVRSGSHARIDDGSYSAPGGPSEPTDPPNWGLIALDVLFMFNMDIGAWEGPPVAGYRVGFAKQTTSSQNGWYLTELVEPEEGPPYSVIDVSSKETMLVADKRGYLISADQTFEDPSVFGEREDFYDLTMTPTGFPTQWTVSTNDGSAYFLKSFRPSWDAMATLFGAYFPVAFNDRTSTTSLQMDKSMFVLSGATEFATGDITFTLPPHLGLVAPHIILNVGPPGAYNVIVRNHSSEEGTGYINEVLKPGEISIFIPDQVKWVRIRMPQRAEHIPFAEEGWTANNVHEALLELRDLGGGGGGDATDRERYRGLWDEEATYLTNDSVNYGGGVWIALDPSEGIVPGTDVPEWFQTGITNDYWNNLVDTLATLGSEKITASQATTLAEAAIAAWVGLAPGAYDTLIEIAAKFEDSDDIIEAILTTLSTKVDTTDTRLSNARTPTSHAASHASAGSDPLSLSASQITSGTIDAARLPASTTVNPMFGTGVDGNVTISGTTVLTSDMHYNNLTVTGVLEPNGFRVFVKGTLSGNGVIDADAVQPTGQSGGQGGNTAAIYNAAGSGGTGGAVATAGTQAGAVTNSMGGGGAAGGAGDSGGAGGASRASSPPAEAAGGFRLVYDLLSFSKGQAIGSLSTRLAGGVGGSGGGGSAAVTGNGGGGGGGVVLVLAHLVTFTGVIRAKGAQGGGSRMSGGGGGGGGGVVVVATSSPTATFTTDVSGGAGGAPVAPNSPGSAGSAGTAVLHLGV